MFQNKLKEEGEDGDEGPDTLYARITEAVGRLNEVARDSLVALELGGDGGGQQFQGYLGPGGVLSNLNLRLKTVGEVKVVPASIGERRAVLGSKPAPLLLSGGKESMVRLRVGGNWYAQIEAD